MAKLQLHVVRSCLYVKEKQKLLSCFTSSESTLPGDLDASGSPVASEDE